MKKKDATPGEDDKKEISLGGSQDIIYLFDSLVLQHTPGGISIAETVVSLASARVILADSSAGR
jgi:hypothetical protein